MTTEPFNPFQESPGHYATGGILPPATPQAVAVPDARSVWSVMEGLDMICVCYGAKAQERAEKIARLWNADTPRVLTFEEALEAKGEFDVGGEG